MIYMIYGWRVSVVHRCACGCIHCTVCSTMNGVRHEVRCVTCEALVGPPMTWCDATAFYLQAAFELVHGNAHAATPMLVHLPHEQDPEDHHTRGSLGFRVFKVFRVISSYVRSDGTRHVHEACKKACICQNN